MLANKRGIKSMTIGIYCKDTHGGPFIYSTLLEKYIPDVELFDDINSIDKYDLVHLQFQFPPRIVDILKSKKIPFVITFHGFVPLKYCSTFKKKIAMIYHRYRVMKAIKHAKEVISVSDFSNKQIRNIGIVIHHGVELDKIKFVKDKENMVLFCNPREKYEGYEIVKRSKIDTLPSFAEHSYQKDPIDHETMLREFARAKILVQPSIWESFGIPVLEAMASGTLVIASNIESHKELFHNIVFFDVNNPEQLNNLVKFYLEEKNESSRIDITKKARKEVEEKYDVRDMAKKTKKVYEKIIGENVSI